MTARTARSHRVRGRTLSAFVLAATLLASVGAGLATASAASAASGPATVDLGTAGPFAALAGTTVTNTGPSVINGDLGVSPGTAVTGIPPGVVNGTVHAADAVAAQAQSDLTTAYNDAAGRAPDANLTGQDLGGLTEPAGVYKFDSSAGLTGTLTLDAQGDPDAVFIFQMGSTLTTASASNVSLVNDAQPCHVFWQIGSSATLGTATSFVGNVLAETSITATTDVTVNGSLLAQNGAVTMDTNTITHADCASPPVPSISVGKTASPTSRRAPGGSFSFTVSVTNTSTEDVVLTSLTDDVYGDLNGKGTCATGGTIAPSAIYSCTFTGSFTGAAGASQTDTVTAVVTDSHSNTATASAQATVTLTAARTGYVEICKRASGPGVTGYFTFTVGSQTVRVPVGACSGVIQLPAGRATITELQQAPYQLAGCQTQPLNRLVGCDQHAQTATVVIVAGGTAQQTVVIFTNRRLTGVIKVCKVAGPGVTIGEKVGFTVNGRRITVPAGPAPGGYCVLAGAFPLGSHVTVTEQIPTGEQVTAIAVSPADRQISVDLNAGQVVIRTGKGFTDVTFTDAVNQPPSSRR